MSLLAATHPLFHFGFDSPLVLLTYSTHATLYDRRLRLPVWTKGQIIAGRTSQKMIGRNDEFHIDHTLSDNDFVDPKAFGEHNKVCEPEKKVDLGHGFGSQARRVDSLDQHDIDVITNVWPEHPGMNRFTKQVTEGHIVDLGQDSKTRRLIVTNGPGFYLQKPVEWLQSERNGCAIPHFSWAHIIQITPTSLAMWAFVYENTFERPKLEVLSTYDLGCRLGFNLAGNVKSTQGLKEIRRERKPWWE